MLGTFLPGPSPSSSSWVHHGLEKKQQAGFIIAWCHAMLLWPDLWKKPRGREGSWEMGGSCGKRQVSESNAGLEC